MMTPLWRDHARGTGYHVEPIPGDVNPFAGAAADVRHLTIRVPGLTRLSVRWDIVICPVDLISNSLRCRKMSAMLRFRHVEKLLDALPSLTEIFRLVRNMEHVLTHC